MNATALATDREPRKRVRLRLRADLTITPQKFEGRTYYVVKDPVRLKYFRFQEREHFILRHLDGGHSLSDVQRAFEQHYRPQRLTLETVETFAQRVLRDGLVLSEAPQIGPQLWERRQTERRQRWFRTLANFLYIKIPLCDPDRFLARVAPLCGWIFQPVAFMLSLGLILSAVLLVGLHFDTFQDRLAANHDWFGFPFLVCVWLTLGVVKVLHELGHGLCCKLFGGEVHEMGLLLLCLSPCCYCNVSDAWTLPSKWRRIAISCAGIYIELILAALATFIWWHTPSQSFLNHLSLGVMLVCSIGTVMFNANPLLRYDGYYILADWLEVPNLHEFSNQLVKHTLMKHCLGVAVKPMKPTPLARRLGLMLYAVVSYLYRWVLLYGILWFIYMTLKPYRLGAVGVLIAAFLVGLTIGTPLYRLGQGLRQRGRLPDMDRLRLRVSAVIVLALVGVVTLLPLPIGHIRATALVQLANEAVDNVYVPSSGTLERLHVRDGQWVEKGEILAEFRSFELETNREEARSAHDIRLVHSRALRDRADMARDAVEQASVGLALARTGHERNLYSGELAVYDHQLKRLEVRAPRAGVVMGAPRLESVGRHWDKEEASPLCKIGAPNRLRALVPLAPEDYRLLKQVHRADPDALVTIRLPGRDLQTWKGRVHRLSEADAQNIPSQLSAQAGGGVPAKRAVQNHAEPLSPHYFATIDFLDFDDAIYPGTLAEIKIPCKWRTCAWWLWRTLARTFDLGLI